MKIVGFPIWQLIFSSISCHTLHDIIGVFSVNYETFDILGDEEVRQGLKTFSNWPTYPQLYVKGELIGGLDIIKVCKTFSNWLTCPQLYVKGELIGGLDIIEVCMTFSDWPTYPQLHVLSR